MPLQFYQPRIVKYWNGSSWVVPQDFGNVKMWNGSTWSHVGIRPYADFASGSFTPSGGASAASPVYLEDYGFEGLDASVRITCTESAVWTHNGSNYASVISGGASTAITFSLNTTPFSSSVNIQCSATTGGGAPQYWDITLESIGDF